MKSTWKTVILLLCAVLLCSAAAPAEAEETHKVIDNGDYIYILLDDDSARIGKYNGNSKNLIIPAELDNHTVTGIEDLAFFYQYNILYYNN